MASWGRARLLILSMVPERGLEPLRPKAADFKSAASTDSATPAGSRLLRENLPEAGDFGRVERQRAPCFVTFRDEIEAAEGEYSPIRMSENSPEGRSRNPGGGSWPVVRAVKESGRTVQVLCFQQMAWRYRWCAAGLSRIGVTRSRFRWVCNLVCKVGPLSSDHDAGDFHDDIGEGCLGHERGEFSDAAAVRLLGPRPRPERRAA